MFPPDRLAALLSLGLMELARAGLWLALIPLGAGETGARAAMVGLALSLHYTTETLLKLAAGWVVDLLGARRVLPLSLALATGAAALLAFLRTSPAALIGGAVLLGLCTAPAWLAVIQAVAPPGEASGGKMGAIWLAWLAGMGGGPVLTGLAMEYLPGRTVALGLTAAMGLAFLAVTLLPPAPRPAGPSDLTRPLAALRGQWRELAPLAPALVGQTLIAGMMAPVLPRVAQEMAGLSPAQYSAMLTAGGAACLLGMLPGGWLVDRIGGRRILVGGFVALGAMLGLLGGLLLTGRVGPAAAGASPLVPIALAAAGGLTYALLLPAWTSTVGRAVPADAVGTGWGLISTLEGAGLALGPVIGGSLWSLAPAAMLAAAALTLILLGLYYRIAPLPTERPRPQGGSRCPTG
ncbi:MAG: MFS transporter [Bacillota bacterium]